jgi:hypothetical protein
MGSINSSFSNSPGVTASMLRMIYLLVVINNFNVFRTSFGTAEAHPKLLVDSNAMLTSATTCQLLGILTLKQYDHA